MIIHYARVKIESAKVMSSYGDCDFTFSYVEGTRPEFLELSLDGHCLRNRMMKQMNAKNVDDLIGQDVWIALLSESGEIAGLRGWEYICPHNGKLTPQTIANVPLPEPASTADVLRRLAAHRRGNHPPH